MEGQAWRETPVPKPWVRRMVQAQGIPLTDKALGWWSAHLDGFLRYAVRRGEPLDPIVLGKGYLQMLKETLPPTAEYRRDQTKQALKAFVRGIENWHWKIPQGDLCDLDFASRPVQIQHKTLLINKKRFRVL